MKRAHRRWHRLAWLLVAPAVAAVLGLAVGLRSAVPANADLPPSLAATPAAEGG